MHIYRVTRKKHSRILDGEGSRINGGRWNNVGTACIYTSESRALAVLEYAVNVMVDEIPEDLTIVAFEIPVDKHIIYEPKKLPEKWNSLNVTESTRDYGTKLLTNADHLIIKLPSVVIPQEYNYLINPIHAELKDLKIISVTDFSFDVRLKK